MKITKSQLKEIIKEEVSKLQKKAILENRKRDIIREMRTLNEGGPYIHRGEDGSQTLIIPNDLGDEIDSDDFYNALESQQGDGKMYERDFEVDKEYEVYMDNYEGEQVEVAFKFIENGDKHMGQDAITLDVNSIKVELNENVQVNEEDLNELFGMGKAKKAAEQARKDFEKKLDDFISKEKGLVNKNALIQKAEGDNYEGKLETNVPRGGKFQGKKIINYHCKNDNCRSEASKSKFEKFSDKLQQGAADIQTQMNEEDANVAVEFDIEVPEWLAGKLEQVHTKPGQGSIFAKPIKSVLELVKSHLSKINPQEVEKIANSTGTVSLDSSGIGYDLVLPMDKAKTLKDAQQVEVETIEGPNKIKVPAIKTSEDMGTFSTGKLTIVVRPKKDESGNVLKGQYIVLSAFPGNPDIPRASEWGGKYAVIIPNAQMNESIRKIVRESFNFLNEDVEFKGEVYDKKELFDKIKKDLLTIDWIKDGQIDADHYELFGRSDSDDLEQAVEWGEISSDVATGLVKDVLEDKYKGHGIVVDVDNRSEGDNLLITLKADDDNVLFFQIDYAL
tara:strand:+ start:129 stop:1808 length:1680 start_codon:yes stop_codon:yes gene_type:complete